MGPAGAQGPQGPPGASGSGLGLFNPLQIAVGRWYEANLAVPDIPVGRWPRGITFDGVYMWVCNAGDNTISKIRAQDLTQVGTYPINDWAQYACYDGTYIWVTGHNTLSKLKAVDGSQVATYTIPGSRMAFDGVNLWVTQPGQGLYKIKPADGSILAHVENTELFMDVIFDGSNIWVTRPGDGVKKIRPDDGVILSTVPLNSYALTFDGSNIWVSNSSDNSSTNRVTKIRAADASILGHFDVQAPGYMAFDGVNIWIINGTGNPNYATKLRAADGTLVGTYPLGGQAWWGIAFDGVKMWITKESQHSVAIR
jgi:DNA-binding beta-propeller fold protein YncE